MGGSLCPMSILRNGHVAMSILGVDTHENAPLSVSDENAPVISQMFELITKMFEIRFYCVPIILKPDL